MPASRATSPAAAGSPAARCSTLPCDVSAVVEHVVDGFVLRAGYRRGLERRSQSPVILMTQRRRLDAFLAEQATAAGVEFRDGAAVSEIVSTDETTTELAGAHASRPPTSSARTARTGSSPGPSGSAPTFGSASRWRETWAGETLEPEPYRGTAWVELGVVPGGYGWVFPKGDHANLGVGGWLDEGPKLRSHLARLARAHGVDPDALTEIRGHRLPMRPLGSTPSSSRVLLVGDAAGLVDPLSGDGIYEAFVSARLASEAILAGRPEEYEAALAAALDRHAAASWKAKRVADRFPRACLLAVRAPGVFDAVAGLLRGDLAHPSEASGLARPPLRALARLARMTPPVR